MSRAATGRFLCACLGVLLTVGANARDAAKPSLNEKRETEKGPVLSEAKEPNRMTTLEFLKTRRDRRWRDTPRKVLAFYYTWYGRPENHGHWVHWEDVRPDQHWIASSTHFPEKGAYDSHDPALVDYHLDLAKRYGVDGLIATWWGQGDYTDRALRVVLDRAAPKGVEITIYWETAPGKGQEKRDRAVDDLLYVLETYGSHPAWLKLDGKPVVFVYGRVRLRSRDGTGRS